MATRKYTLTKFRNFRDEQCWRGRKYTISYVRVVAALQRRRVCGWLTNAAYVYFAHIHLHIAIFFLTLATCPPHKTTYQLTACLSVCLSNAHQQYAVSHALPHVCCLWICLLVLCVCVGVVVIRMQVFSFICGIYCHNQAFRKCNFWLWHSCWSLLNFCFVAFLVILSGERVRFAALEQQLSGTWHS